ncbi:FAD/NAD(P)-dependent oxidoreductase [Ancylobacter mangrovi]|uniref:FAD/NAD(P)-dependent oxidoreductase n=1 Tax=Ancylobacter mangrovi TaxID=2972472 RepID=UPI0021623B92|nr:NAD(P)/FAD-dependent oxidoreductase [Ancylobacter mangrovi]MCS0505159.1 NAD(P)/FAD-dependent oxidoreductase [Ancylobacter mangrovi]
MKRVAIVGAGPAGIAAADLLVGRAGISVTLIDEGQQPGGQIFRQPHPGLASDMKRLLGAGHKRLERFRALCSNVLPQLDYRPRTLVWNVFGGELMTLGERGVDSLSYDALLIATGATDRVLPVKGWTMPGVYTLGGAQILLKEQGCLIGRQVVFCGASPLLYLAALQYHRAGGAVAAVLDTTPIAAKVKAIPRLLALPGVLKDGLSYMAALRLAGVPIVVGVTLDAFVGDGRAAEVRYRAGGRAHAVACDAVAYGFGLRPEMQLAELADCALRYDSFRRQWYPDHDGDGRCGHGVYVAGDVAQMGGAEAAVHSGRLAALSILADLGLEAPASPEPDRAALARQLTFQDGLGHAFAWPAAHVAGLAGEVMLCRCEGVSVGEVRRGLRSAGGPQEANRAKAATRCGMGRCQGRFCGPALAELVAAETGADGVARPLDRLRAQPPIKPLPISAVAGEPLA